MSEQDELEALLRAMRPDLPDNEIHAVSEKVRTGCGGVNGELHLLAAGAFAHLRAEKAKERERALEEAAAEADRRINLNGDEIRALKSSAKRENE